MSPPSAATVRMTEEGLLITLSAVRMSVKNSIIVRALRDNVNFADADYSEFARQELNKLIKRSLNDAERVENQRKRLTKFRGTYSYDEDTRQDVKLLAKRRKVYEQLAVSLKEAAASHERVAEIVAGAQSDAAAEIVGALSTRLVEQAQVANEPDYATNRVARMRDLVSIDLALLKDSTAPEY
jgi:flagellar motility protein MotE (MotC chaperone)